MLNVVIPSDKKTLERQGTRNDLNIVPKSGHKRDRQVNTFSIFGELTEGV